jgi:hypothetical protein
MERMDISLPNVHMREYGDNDKKKKFDKRYKKDKKFMKKTYAQAHVSQEWNSRSLVWIRQSPSRLPWTLMVILILIWAAHRLIKRYIAP